MGKLVMALTMAISLLVTTCNREQVPLVERAPEPEHAETWGEVVREPAPVGAMLAGKTDVIQITIRDEVVEPAQLRAKEGHELRLHVLNRSQRTHNFVVEEFGIVGRPLAPGEENYVAFTPSRAGTFPFFGDYSGRVDWKGYLVVR